MTTKGNGTNLLSETLNLLAYALKLKRGVTRIGVRLKVPRCPAGRNLNAGLLYGVKSALASTRSGESTASSSGPPNVLFGSAWLSTATGPVLGDTAPF